ncbi:MAG: hypothetical protein WCE45_04440 [Sedimentisphaerales bacterium]
MNLNFKKLIKLLNTMIFLAFFVISQQDYAADDSQWQPVPQTDYANVLDLIAHGTKTNYEEISSWQGRMSILETRYHYGPNAAKMSNADDTNSIAHNSQHILEIINNTAEFTVDPRNDKLYSKKEKPQALLRAIDLNQDIPVNKNGGYESVRAVLTREQYIWYMPDSLFTSKRNDVRAAMKVAFRERPEERKFDLNGDIRDPRVFFELGGGDSKKLWDLLLQLRSNINERINELVEGYPHIEISSSETATGVKYRIITTWRGGPNYAIKYIRSLLEVDESVGFNAIEIETTNSDSVKIYSKECTYEKIGEVYLPKTVTTKFWNNKGRPTSTSEITIENAGVNKSVPAETFTYKNLGLKNDDKFIDKIEGKEYKYKDANLVFVADVNK